MLDLFDQLHPPSVLRVKVTPKAKHNRVEKHMQPNGEALYKVHVTQVAEKGKANQAVLALLADMLDVRASALCIVRGVTHREKIIHIHRE